MSSEKSNRPQDNPLYQQRLRAWSPMLSMRDASIFFIVTGLVVIGIGLVIYFVDKSVLQYHQEYTHCSSTTGGQLCSANDSELYNATCYCNVTISVDADMPVPVFFYYGLTNYYQNHRQFVNSIDMNQLTGSLDAPSDTCKPLRNNTNGTYYAPCGKMADAIFNDTFTLRRSSDNVAVKWSNKGISMDSDRRRYGKTANWDNTVKPPSWPAPESNRSKNGYADDEELMVWLRPSPLPTFRKLHGVLRQGSDPQFTDGLARGNYTLEIRYNYPVTSFGGTKSFIISNVSWLGGKNVALGYLYLVTGGVELVVGLVLFVFWIKSRGQIEQPHPLIMSTTKF